MNEEFVPFELAKKLKEKGYREDVNAYYGKWENLFEVYPASDMNDASHRASAPTISQVLKWLREEKKIHVVVDVFHDGWDTLIYTDIHTDYIGDYKYNYIDRGDLARSTYEETVLDSIEYIIDNLI